MNKMSYLKRLTITALCVALCVVLPIALHFIQNAGSILLPMHIPVLLCGLVCGWQFGLACGLLGPVFSSLFTGMPPFPILPGMLIELAVYGLICGLMMQLVRTKRLYLDLYISLVCAMLAGRIVAGVCNALIFTSGGYAFSVWMSSYFLAALPGMAIQLVLLPSIVFALEKARLIPARY